MPNDFVMPKRPWYKRKLVLIITALLLVAVGAAGVLLLESAPPSEPTEQEIDKQALYVGTSMPFLFSVVTGRRERMVQIEVQLMVRGEQAQAETQRHLPLLESALLTVFSRQSADNYLTADGKRQVRAEAREELNAVLTEELGHPLIEKVLFTSIVMQ